MKKIGFVMLVSALLLGPVHLSDANDKIQVSRACLDDLLKLHGVHYYDAGFTAVMDEAFDEKERLKSNIYDVKTEDEFNGAISVTNKLVDLFRADDRMQEYDSLHARMEGRYNAPDGKALNTLVELVYGSGC